MFMKLYAEIQNLLWWNYCKIVIYWVESAVLKSRLMQQRLKLDKGQFVAAVHKTRVSVSTYAKVISVGLGQSDNATREKERKGIRQSHHHTCTLKYTNDFIDTAFDSIVMVQCFPILGHSFFQGKCRFIQKGTKWCYHLRTILDRPQCQDETRWHYCPQIMLNKHKGCRARQFW